MSEKIVFFDGVCNLCNSTVQWLIKHDKSNQLKFSSLQSNFAQQRITSTELLKIDSIMYLVDGKFYVKSGAVLRILKSLPFPYSIGIVFLIVPSFISNFVYDWVAKNRYKWFGKRASCMIPTQELKGKFLE